MSKQTHHRVATSQEGVCPHPLSSFLRPSRRPPRGSSTRRRGPRERLHQNPLGGTCVCVSLTKAASQFQLVGNKLLLLAELCPCNTGRVCVCVGLVCVQSG
ncbi:unnamed protein product [Boreogadus saida]